MKFNTDGFNERINYINNSNDMSKLKQNGPNNIDNSFARMRVEERRNMVETTNHDSIIVPKEIRGNKENFLIMNNNINRTNAKPNINNPVSNAINRNMFKR